MNNKFRQLCQQKPTSVCLVCQRLLFPTQVKKLFTHKYSNSLLQMCVELSSEFCTSVQSFICFTCDASLLKGLLPSQGAYCNKLIPPQIPDCLQDLNTLERHLITPIIPFMKIVQLPTGQQKGIHGPVVCVPSDIHKSATCLPRLISDGSLIKVKLKRKLSFKGHYLYQQISPNKVKNALAYLKEHNPHYASVNIRDDYNTLEGAFVQSSSSVNPPNVTGTEVAEG